MCKKGQRSTQPDRDRLVGVVIVWRKNKTSRQHRTHLSCSSSGSSPEEKKSPEIIDNKAWKHSQTSPCYWKSILLIWRRHVLLSEHVIQQFLYSRSTDIFNFCHLFVTALGPFDECPLSTCRGGGRKSDLSKKFLALNRNCLHWLLKVQTYIYTARKGKCQGDSNL